MSSWEQPLRRTVGRAEPGLSCRGKILRETYGLERTRYKRMAAFGQSCGLPTTKNHRDTFGKDRYARDRNVNRAIEDNGGVVTGDTVNG